MMIDKINTIPKKDYKFRFGRQENGDHERPVIQNLENRYRHTYLIGSTGMGKSTTMENLAVSDIEFGNAVIFIDPKGTSTKRLYSLYPNAEYISINNPTVINPIDKPEYNVDEVISEFVQILDVLITLTTSNPTSTVFMREIISNAIRIIDKPENKNIKWLARFLQYDNVRAKIVPKITDQELKEYWNDFDKLKFQKNNPKVETAQRMASRLLEISQGRMADFVIGRNQFDIADIVRNRKVVLIDTSRMSLNQRIYVSNLIVYAVLAYTEFADIKPQPLMVFVDEFQIVVSQWFSDLLARSRDKLVGFTLAHQSFAQIPKNILSVILDNVETKVCFRTGDEPATRLKDYFGITAKELLNLPKHYAWVRIGTNNTLTRCSRPIDVDLINPPVKQIYNFLKEGYMFDTL